MWRVLLGTVVGIYLAQTYNLPLVTDQLKEMEKYLNKNTIEKKTDNDKNR